MSAFFPPVFFKVIFGCVLCVSRVQKPLAIIYIVKNKKLLQLHLRLLFQNSLSFERASVAIRRLGTLFAIL
jgi:hypothetical protein